MRQAAKVDAQGFFVEDVLLGDHDPTPPDTVKTRPQEGFHRPRWTGSAWEEGKPAAEILAVLKAQKRAEMEAAFADETAQSFGGGPAWVGVMVGALATDPRDARIAALKTRATKLRDKLAAVGAATTIEAVGAVRWG